MATKSTDGTAMKMSIESDYEALLTEIRRARAYGVPEIGSREIARVERKLERAVRLNRENMPAVAFMFREYLGRGES